MSLEEHETQRCQFWGIAFSAAFGRNATISAALSAELADEALAEFDARFSAASKDDVF